MMDKATKTQLDWKYMKIECEVLQARHWLKENSDFVPGAHKCVLEAIKKQVKELEKLIK